MAAIALRPARPEDAGDIARMLDLASEGVACWFWARIAAPGEAALAVGERHSATDDSDHSWRKTVVAEVDGGLAGGISTYRLHAAPVLVEEANPMMRAARILENQALGTQHIYHLATFPPFRRRGVARALLAEVERRAAGSPGISLIVLDGNAAAVTLYRTAGYAVAASEPIPPLEGWQSESGSRRLVLMVKPLGLANRRKTV